MTNSNEKIIYLQEFNEERRLKAIEKMKQNILEKIENVKSELNSLLFQLEMMEVTRDAPLEFNETQKCLDDLLQDTIIKVIAVTKNNKEEQGIPVLQSCIDQLNLIIENKEDQNE